TCFGLGGRDSNPDTVVQRTVHGLPCASFRALLSRFCRDDFCPLVSVSVRSRPACLNVSHPSSAVAGQIGSSAFAPIPDSSGGVVLARIIDPLVAEHQSGPWLHPR